MAKGRYKNKEDWEKQGKNRINPKKAKAYNTEYAKFAERLAATGATEMDIAYILNTSTYNLRKWKRENFDFAKAINRGRQLTKAYLIAKGMKAAAGYDYLEKKKQYIADSEGNMTGEVKVTETPKHQPADSRLLMFMISCLDRQLGGDDWVARQFIESKSEKNVNIKVIDGQKIADQFDKLSGKWSKVIDSKIVEPEDEEQKKLAS